MWQGRGSEQLRGRTQKRSRSYGPTLTFCQERGAYAALHRRRLHGFHQQGGGAGSRGEPATGRGHRVPAPGSTGLADGDARRSRDLAACRRLVRAPARARAQVGRGLPPARRSNRRRGDRPMDVTRTARGLRPLQIPRLRLPERARPAAPDRRPSGPARHPAARIRARRRVLRERCRQQPAASRPAPDRRKTLGGLAQNEPPARQVPGRSGGPHQPPQTPLRNVQITPQRPPRSQNLGRLGNPRLQPRHPRHLHSLKASPSRLPPEPPIERPCSARTRPFLFPPTRRR